MTHHYGSEKDLSFKHALLTKEKTHPKPLFGAKANPSPPNSPGAWQFVHTVTPSSLDHFPGRHSKQLEISEPPGRSSSFIFRRPAKRNGRNGRQTKHRDSFFFWGFDLEKPGFNRWGVELVGWLGGWLVGWLGWMAASPRLREATRQTLLTGGSPHGSNGTAPGTWRCSGNRNAMKQLSVRYLRDFLRM